MKPRWQRFTLVLLVVVLALQPLGAFAMDAMPDTPQPAPIDLTTDKNGDGLPDELVAALAELEALDAQARAAGADQSAAEAAMLDFNRRLPFTQETRAAQMKLANYEERLGAVSNQEESDTLAAELAAIQAQMMADPAYKTVKDSMERIAGQRLATLAGAPQTASLLFLPLLQVGGTGEAVVPEANSTGVTPVYPVLPTLDQWPTVTREQLATLPAGYIIFVRGPESRPIWALLRLFTLLFEHAGTVVGQGASKGVLDSKFDLAVPQYGVAVHGLADWLKTGDLVMVAHVAPYQLPADRVAYAVLLGEAEAKKGTPFNFNILDKASHNKFYCAQLLYYMYKTLETWHLDTKSPTPEVIDLDSQSVYYDTYMSAVWGPWLGHYIAVKSIGVDEIWLGALTDDRIIIDGWGTVQ